MMELVLKTIIGPIVVGVVLRLYSMKIKEQTRKLATGCSKHSFEVADKTDEVSHRTKTNVIFGVCLFLFSKIFCLII